MLAGAATYVVLIGVDRLGIEALFTLLLALLDMLAHPDVAVQAENKVYTAGQCDEVGLQPSDQNWRYGHQLPIP